jgi:cytochrome c-type biogenesis protein CcmH/NrfG
MSTRRNQRRRYPRRNRRVWVFSELNADLRPEQLATLITSVSLEQARAEAEARAEHDARQYEDVGADAPIKSPLELAEDSETRHD